MCACMCVCMHKCITPLLDSNIQILRLIQPHYSLKYNLSYDAVPRKEVIKIGGQESTFPPRGPRTLILVYFCNVSIVTKAL